MITPQELRIGNRLEYFINEDGVEWAETIIDWQDFQWVSTFESEFNKKHRPISLTQEWLLKFGFVLNDDGGDMKGNDRFWSRPGFLGSLSIPNLKHSTTGLYIRHVHQLQNLYFALTGEELTPLVKN